MKTLFYAGVAVLALTAGASAADLTYEPAPAAVIAPVVFDWTGFYAGVHAGGGWGDYNTNVGTYTDVLGSASGALGGAQIGYNYQINQFVIGAQTDLAYTGIQTTRDGYTGLAYINAKAQTNWLGSTTVRAGFAADTWLFYAKGGLAYGQVEASAGVTSGPLYASWSSTKWATGWTAGAGVEKAFTKNVTGFLEYDYYDLGNIGGWTSVGATSVDLTTNVVKAGINYKF
ncbi:porin family protein [Kaistia algarum]|uniref:outer membrane protein n=1 Tax=Kaistia algarum TaxID=2083279 RepID=UPI000CE81FD5|nr:outer membrane protein [Kaistia algarum]MCX5514944.1 porin family protein [Kaistia algarum]PPE79691.1 porin family protein [Kaistia algarum]